MNEKMKMHQQMTDEDRAMNENNKKKIHEQLTEAANSNICILTSRIQRICENAMKEYDDDLAFAENSHRVLKNYVDAFIEELEVNIGVAKLSMMIITGKFYED